MNLFICLTNLHLLIAKAIIEKENLYEVDVIFIGDSENRKNKNYISQISPYVRNIKIYPNYKNSSSFKTIKRTLYTKKIMASYERKYDIVHFANFHIPIIHHILSLIKFNKIRTFDDGTHNINKMSIMYAKEKIKKHKLFIRSIMGRKYHKNDILRLRTYPNRILFQTMRPQEKYSMAS